MQFHIRWIFRFAWPALLLVIGVKAQAPFHSPLRPELVTTDIPANRGGLAEFEKTPDARQPHYDHSSPG
jgi:hypothetical protein